MISVFKIIVLIGDILGFVLFITTFIGLKKMQKEHSNLKDDDYLSEEENKKFRKHLKYMLIGLSIFMITSLFYLVLLFLDKPF